MKLRPKLVKDWKTETEYLVFIALIIPSMAVIWSQLGWLFFVIGSLWLAAVLLLVDNESYKYGLALGILGCYNEFLGTSLGLWRYADGQPFLAWFVGFYTIGAAVGVLLPRFKWKEGWEKRYAKNPLLSNPPLALVVGLAVVSTNLLVWFFTESWIVYAFLMLATAAVFIYMDPESVKGAVPFFAIGMAEEYVGVLFGLWGYPPVANPELALVPLFGFPIVATGLSYFADACGITMLLSVLGLGYFRDSAKKSV